VNSIRSDLHEAVTFPVNAGVPVLTSDGKELGTVKEVADGAFKVDVPMRPDYWLARSAILSSAPDRVTMSFESELAESYRLGGPGEVTVVVDEPEPTIDPLLNNAGHPILLDEDEQQAQRERMERELEEQRKRLPNA